MSETANSMAARTSPKGERLTQGMKLYGASARNLSPRLIAMATVIVVAVQCIDPIWLTLWAVLVVAGLLLGLRLFAELERDTSPQARRLIDRGAQVNSVLQGWIQTALLVAMWSNGSYMIKGFALVSAFIGAAYVLLQYYADKARFGVLLLPYLCLFAFMGYDLGRLTGWSPGVGVTIAACAVAMFNFFRPARQLLDRSRSALRRARAQAQQGEIAAEAANAAKSTFLATMSHEIRTPLNGVLGMAQAMAGDELSERQRDRLGVIHGSGEALLAILNDVLDLSKIEAGKLELEQVEFELAEVARGAYSAFTALANKKGLSFALDIEAARGRYVGDPTRIRQVLYNLISNALKFTEQGEIRVAATREGGHLVVTVADTGVGIAPASLTKLFVKFDQLDSSTTRRFGGTGLGLAICRELAQLMSGEIAVESELGRGSKFIVRLPLQWVGDERSQPAALEARREIEPEAMSLRVLAAEDNAVNQLVLKTLLHQMGVEPVVVDNGRDAVEAWEREDWDVILMDIQMPVMDGLTATGLIRARERELGRSRTPIVALTANAMSHHVTQYTAAGMDGHVAKPIQAAELYATLSACIVAANPVVSASPVADVA